LTVELSKDRFRGALIGLAVGDAVGTTVEFQPPGSFPLVTDMTGGGPFSLKPGQWTDDTSMALCLAESLVETGGFDPVDQLTRYVRWFREGHRSSTGRFFDIGTTTREALVRFEETGSPYPGSTHENAAGNGSIMRLAPVPLFFAREGIEVAAERSGESSRTTHGALQAVDACRLLGAIIAAAVAGASKAEILDPVFWTGGPLDPAIAAIAAGSWREKAPPEIRGSGWCVASLEAALWAFGATDDFESGCLAAVNLGNDADTTAAVFGQIAGAVYGESGIPARWRERLWDGPAIGQLAADLWQVAHGLPVVSMPITPAAPAAPLPETFWLETGVLLAGNYPGSPSKAEAAAKLGALLAARVGAFVDLTEHGAAGFRAYEGLLAEVAKDRGLRVAYHRLPVEDVTAPSQAAIGRALAVIDAEFALGHVVYLHCRGGRGRTGVIGSAWLADRYGLDGDAAMARFQKARAGIPSARYPAPETAEQCEAVRLWAKRASRPT
jgi:ADP-ribosylglycohydrolase